MFLVDSPEGRLRADDAFRLAITGLSGTGKTTLLCRWLECTPATVRFIFDHVGTISRYLGRPALTRRALIPAACSTGWVIFNPHVEFPGEPERACDWFAQAAYHASRKIPGRKLWVCDELQDFARHSVPMGIRLTFKSGRNYGLGCACIDQGPNALEWTLAPQFTEMISFTHKLPAVLRSLSERGFDPKKVAALPMRHYIDRNLLTGSEVTGRL